MSDLNETRALFTRPLAVVDEKLARVSDAIRELEALKHWTLGYVPESDCECYRTDRRHEECGYTKAMVAKRGGSFVRRKELRRVIRKLRGIIGEENDT